MGLRAFSAPVRAPGQFWVEGGLTSTLAGARSYILFGRSENPQFDGARCWNTLLAKQDRGGYICKLQDDLGNVHRNQTRFCGKRQNIFLFYKLCRKFYATFNEIG